MSTTCTCPAPGGQVTCEAGQFPTCRIYNGKVDARCYTPPSGASPRALQNWVLQIVMGQLRLPTQEVTAEERRLLERGMHQRLDGTLIHFRMPQPSSEGTPSASA